MNFIFISLRDSKTSASSKPANIQMAFQYLNRRCALLMVMKYYFPHWLLQAWYDHGLLGYLHNDCTL